MVVSLSFPSLAVEIQDVEAWAARLQWNFVLNSAPSASDLTEFALEECCAKFLWAESRKQ